MVLGGTGGVHGPVCTGGVHGGGVYGSGVHALVCMRWCARSCEL